MDVGGVRGGEYRVPLPQQARHESCSQGPRRRSPASAPPARTRPGRCGPGESLREWRQRSSYVRKGEDQIGLAIAESTAEMDGSQGDGIIVVVVSEHREPAWIGKVVRKESVNRDARIGMTKESIPIPLREKARLGRSCACRDLKGRKSVGMGRAGLGGGVKSSHWRASRQSADDVSARESLAEARAALARSSIIALHPMRLGLRAGSSCRVDLPRRVIWRLAWTRIWPTTLPALLCSAHHGVQARSIVA